MSVKKLKKKRDIFTDLPFDCLYECVCFMKSSRDFLSVLLSVKGFREFLILHQREIKNIRYVMFKIPDLNTYPLAQNLSLREGNLREWLSFQSFENLKGILSKFPLLKCLDICEIERISHLDSFHLRNFDFGRLECLKELSVTLSSHREKNDSLEFWIDLPLLESLSFQNNNVKPTYYYYLEINIFPKKLKSLYLKRVFINATSSENYLDDISSELRNLYLIGTVFPSSHHGFSNEHFPRLRRLLLETVFAMHAQSGIITLYDQEIFVLRNLPNLEFLKIGLDLGVVGKASKASWCENIPFQFDETDFRKTTQTWESLKILDLSANIPISLFGNLSNFKNLEVFKLNVSSIDWPLNVTNDSKRIVIQNVENLRRLRLSNFALASTIKVNRCAKLRKIRLFFLRIWSIAENQPNLSISLENLLSLEKLHLSTSLDDRKRIIFPEFKLVNVNLLKTLIVESGFDDELRGILTSLEMIDTLELSGITRDVNGDINKIGSRHVDVVQVDVERMKTILHNVRRLDIYSPSLKNEKIHIEVLKIKEFNYYQKPKGIHNEKELPLTNTNTAYQTACNDNGVSIFSNLRKLVIEWDVGSDCPLDEDDLTCVRCDCMVELNVVRRISRKRKKIVHSFSSPYSWSGRAEIKNKIIDFQNMSKKCVGEN